MAVTHNLAGYTGTVDQIDEARRFGLAGGGRFKVLSATDWVPSASSTVNRTINISAGSAMACGVYDITTQVDSVVCATNSSGVDRFDAVVATFDWGSGTVTFRVVTGTSATPPIVKTGTTVDATKINWLPGISYDAVLAIVRVRAGVTIIAPADVFDIRPFGNWYNLAVTNLQQYAYCIDVDINGRVHDLSTTISPSGGLTWEYTGFGWRMAGPISWSVEKATTQTLAANTWTLVTPWASSPATQASFYMWNGGLPSRLIAPATGPYTVTAMVPGAMNLQIRSNAAGNAANGRMVVATTATTGVVPSTGRTGYYLTAGDHVEVFAWRDTAGTVGNQSGYTPHFGLTYLGQP